MKIQNFAENLWAWPGPVAVFRLLRGDWDRCLRREYLEKSKHEEGWPRAEGLGAARLRGLWAALGAAWSRVFSARSRLRHKEMVTAFTKDRAMQLAGLVIGKVG